MSTKTPAEDYWEWMGHPMAKKKEHRIKVNPNKIKVRDERIKDMITSPGGVVRVFEDKKKAKKADKVGRNRKHKNKED